MKTAKDPRHLKRITAFKALFSWDFKHKRPFNLLAVEAVKKQKEIDKLISEAAVLWEIEKIAKTDLAILRLAVYELVFAKKEPVKVIIDEAIEIAKEYGSDSSSSFVNGVLGTIIKRVT